MLDLVRLSSRPIFPPGGVELYRHVALLTDLSPGMEVLEAACGTAVPLEYWVTEYDVNGSGVDPDPAAIERAEARIRDRGLSDRAQFQNAPLDDLPYRDEIFDVAVAEMGLTAHADPEEAIRELVRVTRPGGTVVLVQLVWTAPVDERRRKVLSSHLGARPLMLVELKRILRETGVRELHTEDWSDEETAFRRSVTKPFPDFTELFSLPEKLGILRRAWRRWGWSGVKAALLREREVHRLLTRERVIALDLILGTKEVRPGASGEPPKDGRRSRRPTGERAPLPDGGRPESDAGGPEGEPDDAEPEARDEADGSGAAEGGDGRRSGGDPSEADGSDDEADREVDDEDDQRHEQTAGLPLFGRADDER